MRRLLNRCRRLRPLSDCAGANILEAAIITPLLLLLTFSTIDFGALFYVYLSLQNGVSQATRFAVTGNTMPNKSRAESIKAAMRQATPTLTIPDSAFTFKHLPKGGAAFVGGVGAPDEIEKVSVEYTWNIMTPVLKPFFTNGQIKFKVESSMKNEGAAN